MQKPRITSNFHLAMAALFVCVAALSVTAAEEDKGEKDKETEKRDYLIGNHTCPVMGETVDDKSFVEYRNEEKQVYGRIYMCCDGCAEKVEENIDKLYQTLYRTDDKTGEEKPPLDLKNETCPISGEKIEKRTSLEYNGFIVGFCCSDCVKQFLDNPDPSLIKAIPNPEDYKYERPAGSGSSK